MYGITPLFGGEGSNKFIEIRIYLLPLRETDNTFQDLNTDFKYRLDLSREKTQQ